MKRFLFLLLITAVASCTNIRDTKISAPDSHKALMEICQELDSSTSNKIKEKYKSILKYSEMEENGKILIISIYGIRYEDISFSDLIDYLK